MLILETQEGFFQNLFFPLAANHVRHLHRLLLMAARLPALKKYWPIGSEDLCKAFCASDTFLLETPAARDTKSFWRHKMIWRKQIRWSQKELTNSKTLASSAKLLLTKTCFASPNNSSARENLCFVCDCSFANPCFY